MSLIKIETWASMLSICKDLWGVIPATGIASWCASFGQVVAVLGWPLTVFLLLCIILLVFSAIKPNNKAHKRALEQMRVDGYNEVYRDPDRTDEGREEELGKWVKKVGKYLEDHFPNEIYASGFENVGPPEIGQDLSDPKDRFIRKHKVLRAIIETL